MNFETFLDITSVCTRHKDKMFMRQSCVHKGKNMQVLRQKRPHGKADCALRYETVFKVLCWKRKEIL